MFPTPKQLGLPDKYKTWRPNQPKAIRDAIDSVKRFIVQLQRQGEGKTVTILSQGLIENTKRWIYLTSTKGLQDQLMKDGEGTGLVKIEGKANYTCQSNPTHSCADGYVARCMYKGSSMCPWAEAKYAACSSRLVSSNYPCFISSYKYGQGFGKFDVMVCDEAHDVPAQIAKAMQILLGEREIYEDLKKEWPDHRSRGDMEAWKYWARVSRVQADTHLQRLKIEMEKRSGKPDHKTVKEYQHFTQLVRKLSDLATCNPEKWVVDEWAHGFQFDPIEPAEYAERTLWRGIEKVILTSGTVRYKTTEQLDIDPTDCDFFEYFSTVNPARSPIMYIPTTKVNRYSQPWELRKLVARIDEIFESRADRKGIIHTSSYKIRDFIIQNSKYSRFMVSNWNNNGDITSNVVNSFKEIPPPALLVSPSVTTGYDFPYDECRYQIIAKLNYPYVGSKIEQARLKLEPDRSTYHAVLQLQQAATRGDRAHDDFQEVFILDDAFPYLIWKHREMFDPTFLICVKKLSKVPPAPEIAA